VYLVNSSFKILPGTPHPLGATVDSRGVNFSVFSQNATSIELLLFEKAGSETPIEIIKLDKESNLTSHFWHVYVQGLVPGFFYAYSVDGPFQPEVGQIFNKNKVLIDPYSKGIDYSLWRREDAVGPGDNLKTSLRSAIIDTKKYNWEGDKPLGLPLEETIIYELHVGNFTKSKTSSCENRGTFSGLVEKIPYLKDLGITAVELMPVFDFDTGPEKNVWGYGSLGFFAPESTYCKSPGNASHANDFRNMVKALHRAGIEVILDVVFGFTNEKDETGPFLSFFHPISRKIKL
jgi:glycogen operon protein